MNISTPDILNKNNKSLAIQESGILSEIERFGGRIDQVRSTHFLNIKICDDYLQKIEADQDDKFDLDGANVILDCSPVCSMALDMYQKTVMFEQIYYKI